MGIDFYMLSNLCKNKTHIWVRFSGVHKLLAKMCINTRHFAFKLDVILT